LHRTATDFQGTRPETVAKVLNLWVGHQSSGHIPDSSLKLSDGLVLTEFAQKTSFLGERLFLVVFWVTVVSIRADSRGTAEVLKSRFGFGSSLGIISTPSKVLV
jgi:hypothetical protein